MQDPEQVKRSISVEHFETFDPDTQLKVIRRLQHSIAIVKVAEQDFSSEQFQELITYLDNRLNELQIIYNIKSNRTLDDFW